MNDRARITIPDLLVYAVALAAVAGLYPVFQSLLGSSDITGRLGLMLQTIGPAMALVFLAMVLSKAGVSPR